ncbi:MAG: MFS transporter [Spirochaetota bacterium]
MRHPSLAGLAGLLDSRIRRVARTELDHRQVANLRFFWLDGFFASLSDNFVLGFMELFLLAYHANNATIGTLSSVASLTGMVALLPGARFVARMGRRKDFVVWTSGIWGRLTLLVVALLPLVVRESSVAIVSLITLNAIRAFGNNVANPGATALIADFVPPTSRARYFASRNAATIVAAAVAAPVAGWIVKNFDGGVGLPWLGYQLIYFIAFAIGMISTACFSRIQEPEKASSGVAWGGLGELVRELRSDRLFVGLALSAFVWNLSLNVAGPFFNVYFIKELGGTAAWVGLSAGIGSVFGFLGQGTFSRSADKRGDIHVQAVTGILICFLPLGWSFASSPWHVVIIGGLAGYLWSGYNLANFNILLQLTPDRRRAEAVALYQTIVAASAALGPFLGGLMADSIGFKALFAVSSAGRIVGIVMFIALVARWPLRR